MDAPCKIQGNIHVFRLVNNMCPGKWVHIKTPRVFFLVVLVDRLFQYVVEHILGPIKIKL